MRSQERDALKRLPKTHVVSEDSPLPGPRSRLHPAHTCELIVPQNLRQIPDPLAQDRLRQRVSSPR